MRSQPGRRNNSTKPCSGDRTDAIDNLISDELAGLRALLTMIPASEIIAPVGFPLRIALKDARLQRVVASMRCIIFGFFLSVDVWHFYRIHRQPFCKIKDIFFNSA